MVLSEKECRQSFRAPKMIKDRVMLSLMYSAGLRMCELKNLKKSDLDTHRMTIHIRQSKYNKDRYVILSPLILKALKSIWKKYNQKSGFSAVELKIVPFLLHFTIYEKRWGVEVFHKSLKQNAGLSKSPTKYEVTQSNHIFASMIAYCKLEVLKIKEKKNHFAIKAQLYLKALKAAYQELLELKNSITPIIPLIEQASPLLGSHIKQNLKLS